MVPDGLQQEAFAAAVLAHDEAEGRAALLNHVDVVEYGGNFPGTAYRDVFQARPGHHAAFQGVD